MSESLLEGGAEAPVESDATSRDYVIESDVTSQPDRPEWLPEKYSSGEDLAKAYKELESKLGGKEEDIKSKLMEEIQTEAFSSRPDSAGDYQLPDVIDAEAAVDNDLLRWWSEHSFENGFSQEEFQKGIEMYASSNMEDSGPDLEAESKKLGENASTRIEAASMFASKFFPEESLPAIERMCESHEGIIALEAIQDALKGGSFAGNAQPTAGLNEAKLREMMNDPRYHNPRDRDPNFVREVEEGFKQVYRS
jgi:hypothetical protein|tara:strand:+ start:614 stop:1366 length:753 start_codon:yes stop_codon:yes gene_type:complete